MKRNRELRRVRRAQRNDVAFSDTAPSQAGGDAPHLLAQLVVGDGSPRDTIDECDVFRQPTPGAEHKAGEVLDRDSDVRVWTAEDQIASPSLGTRVPASVTAAPRCDWGRSGEYGLAIRGGDRGLPDVHRLFVLRAQSRAP